MKKFIIITVVVAISTAVLMLVLNKDSNSFDLSKRYSYYEKFTLNNNILSEGVMTVSYGDYITNQYGITCVQELFSLQTFEGEIVHETRRLVSIDFETGDRYLCGYYIPDSNRYVFYNDRELFPQGLIFQYPQNLSQNRVLNSISIDDEQTCDRTVLGTQTTRANSEDYKTIAVEMKCSQPLFNYSLESYFNETLRVVILEKEIYTNDNDTFNIYRELLSVEN